MHICAARNEMNERSSVVSGVVLVVFYHDVNLKALEVSHKQLSLISDMDVSENRGVPPKSSIFIGFSIINHPFWDTPIFGNTHMGVDENINLTHPELIQLIHCFFVLAPSHFHAGNPVFGLRSSNGRLMRKHGSWIREMFFFAKWAKWWLQQYKRKHELF